MTNSGTVRGISGGSLSHTPLFSQANGAFSRVSEEDKEKFLLLISREVYDYKPEVGEFFSRNKEILVPLVCAGVRDGIITGDLSAVPDAVVNCVRRDDLTDDYITSVHTVCDVVFELTAQGQVLNPWVSGIKIERVMFSDEDKAKRCPYSDCLSASMGWEHVKHFRVCAYCGTLVLPVSWNVLNPGMWWVYKNNMRFSYDRLKEDVYDYGLYYASRTRVKDAAFRISRSVSRVMQWGKDKVRER